jgi:hypothetical protein
LDGVWCGSMWVFQQIWTIILFRFLVGAELGYASLLASGLIKLGKDNLSLPIDDWLYSAVHHSHPPIPERILALKKYVWVACVISLTYGCEHVK